MASKYLGYIKAFYVKSKSSSLIIYNLMKVLKKTKIFPGGSRLNVVLDTIKVENEFILNVVCTHCKTIEIHVWYSCEFTIISFRLFSMLILVMLK